MMPEDKTLEELTEELKSHVVIRDKMCGAMYWNILNDECCKMANKCVAMGGDRNEISQILGEGTHIK